MSNYDMLLVHNQALECIHNRCDHVDASQCYSGIHRLYVELVAAAARVERLEKALSALLSPCVDIDENNVPASEAEWTSAIQGAYAALTDAGREGT